MLYKNEKIDNNFETKLPRKIYKHKIKTYVIITTITLLVGVNIKKKKTLQPFTVLPTITDGSLVL